MLSKYSNPNITLTEFFLRAYTTINPSDDLIHNWHIDYIIAELQEIESGRNNRLLINLPPRSLKSIIISVVWPAWILGQDPSKRIIVASYSRFLATKHSEDTRAIMESEWFKSLFPNCKLDRRSNTKAKFKTTEHGFRFSTSTTGTLTGEGADLLIADDPITPFKASSKSERNKTRDWFDQTFATRLNNKSKGAIVVVMQRLHAQDLSEHILAKGLYRHLCLPIISENTQELSAGSFSYRRPQGQILNEVMDSIDSINKLKLEVGSYVFQSQYMQRPINPDGGLLRTSWLRYFDAEFEADLCFQSWDIASSNNSNSDYSVGINFKIVGKNVYITDLIRVRNLYSELKSKVKDFYEQHTPATVLIENKSSGVALLQELKEHHFPVKAVNPRIDKVSRVMRVSGLIEAGRLHLPSKAPWLGDFEYEYSNFPDTEHDDQIDALSQFLEWYLETFSKIRGIRSL